MSCISMTVIAIIDLKSDYFLWDTKTVIHNRLSMCWIFTTVYQITVLDHARRLHTKTVFKDRLSMYCHFTTVPETVLVCSFFFLLVFFWRFLLYFFCVALRLHFFQCSFLYFHLFLFLSWFFFYGIFFFSLGRKLFYMKFFGI